MGHPKYLLDVQYRMDPSISLFPNSKFYQNQILDGANVQKKSYKRCYLQGQMFGPYSFINVRGGREELDDAGVSRRNMVEVAVVVKLVHKLIKGMHNVSILFQMHLLPSNNFESMNGLAALIITPWSKNKKGPPSYWLRRGF